MSSASPIRSASPWLVEVFMKDAIHPHYVETTVTCACGNVIETRATKMGIKIEVCSNCHPFFTGKHKLLDTEGRVERFLNKYKKTGTAAK
jgi:large subunit ribosomal protein L31